MSSARSDILAVQIRAAPAGADLNAFQARVRKDFTGDARPRPLDCTRRRFLVRREAMDRFASLAHQHDLHVELEAAPAG